MQPAEGKYTLFRVRALFLLLPTSFLDPRVSPHSRALPPRHSAETTLLKYELMKLQLTSLLPAVKLDHPGYQLNYSAFSSSPGVLSCRAAARHKAFPAGRCKEAACRSTCIPPAKREERGKREHCKTRETPTAHRDAWGEGWSRVLCRSCCHAVVSQSVHPHRRG